MKVNGIHPNQINLMIKNSQKQMKIKRTSADIEAQKLELVRLRIRNKFYDRDEILRKVVQDLYENDLRNK